MFCVVGSGPASISCAVALAGRGVPVTILDVGRTIEPEHRAVLDRLARQEPEAWAQADLDALRGGDQKTREGSIHVKLSYGSEYPYSDARHPLVEPGQPTQFHYSMARGGLSNVWGASLLPNRPQDMADWPVSLAELEPHYRAVLDFMPSTSVVDELETLLPTYTQRGEEWRASQQASALVEDLRKHRERLRRAGIGFGRSRMAVRVSGDAQRRGCVYCGLCLYGCPYSLIYSTAQTLERLIEEKKVTYISGQVVERIEPHGAGVRIHAQDAQTGELRNFDATRVFLGAGILPTAHIALTSLGAYNTPRELLDSQYFIFPFFRFAKTPGVQNEELASLAQAFLEIDDARVSRQLVHVEVFSYSDFLKRALLETPLRFFLKNRWVAEQMFGRLMVLQCFLHSDDSSRLSLELRRDGSTARPLLHLRAEPRRRALWTSLKAGMKLAANALSLRGVPIVPAMQFAAPGRSYHSGGTFPMRRAPQPFETDTLGRLSGMERVHLIDASIFPSIPATTITLTVIANAHRIGTQSAGL